MTLLQVVEEGAEVVEFLGPEINPVAGGGTMAAKIDQDATPTFFGEKVRPRKHAQAVDAIAMEQNYGAASERGWLGVEWVGAVRGKSEVEFAASFVQAIGPAEIVITGLNDPVANFGGRFGDADVAVSERRQNVPVEGERDGSLWSEPLRIAVWCLGDTAGGKVAATAKENHDQKQKR